MDLTQDITYRGFLLNDSEVPDNVTPSGITGCVVESVDYSDVDVVQHVEKRSQQDGMDAGIPLLGVRRVRMAGTLYAASRPLLFDALDELQSALSPGLAYLEEPLDYGYQPLIFSTATARTDEGEFPDGFIQKRILAMPRAFQAMFQRDSIGGDGDMPLAIPWQATLIAKDPSITGAEYQEYDLTGGSPKTGNFINRGYMPSPLRMLIATGTAAGSIVVSAGDSLFTITVPASTGSRIIRLNDKVLTVEEDDVEVPRMDLITFSGDTTWPQVPAGTTAYTVTFNTVTHTTGSIMWFYERYA